MIEYELSAREQSILRAIIQQFILTASPVGSRNITKKFDVGCSPATVRNIMSDLEDHGYINHPHTSAGRVPTDKGYRYYVDSLMQLHRLSKAERNSITKKLEAHLKDSDDLLLIASKILSEITKQLAYVIYPRMDTGVLEKLQIVQLSGTRVLIVLTVKTGHVRTITLEMNFELKEAQLISVQQLLNERLAGLSLTEIRQTFKERLKNTDEDVKPILNFFIDSSETLFSDSANNEKTVISGVKNLLKHPEFELPEKFETIVELIEQKDIIIHLFEKTKEQNDLVTVSIGNELDDKMNDYSFIFKEYSIGEMRGTLGIIGPKRMPYEKIVAIVDYIGNVLSQFLTRN